MRGKRREKAFVLVLDAERLVRSCIGSFVPARQCGSRQGTRTDSTFVRSEGEVIAAGFLGAGMQVTPGRRERRVAQRLPDGGEVGAAVEGMRPVRVAQEVRGNEGFQAGFAGRATHAVPRVPGGHREDAIVAQGVGRAAALATLPRFPARAARRASVRPCREYWRRRR
jgi:hypothetical protein